MERQLRIRMDGKAERLYFRQPAANKRKCPLITLPIVSIKTATWQDALSTHVMKSSRLFLVKYEVRTFLL
jgi:hypothetical protein